MSNYLKTIVVKPDGTCERETLDRGDLYAWQNIVGGNIEVAPIIEGEDADGDLAFARDSIVVNEEGKLDGLPVNPIATMLARIPGDIIVGTVFLIGPPDANGDSTEADLPKWEAKLVELGAVVR